MQASPSLQLKASQSLVMTQALQQSIKLLQMNAMELQAFVEMEMEKNPFLQDGEESSDFASDAQEENEDTESEYTATDDWQEAAPHDQESWEYEPTERIKVSAQADDGQEHDFLAQEEKELSLREHLSEQVALEFTNPIEQRVALHIIDGIDDAGYFREDLTLFSDNLGIKPAYAEKILQGVQKLDPAGVGARDLKECLKLQLIDQNRFDPAMEALLNNLSLLANAQLDQLKRKCGVDMDDLKAMIAELRALNPKPGARFVKEVTQVAVPDVLMRRDQSGKWHIELNSANLPKVLVNRRYYSEVNVHAKGADKKYMSEQMNIANWLTKALDQRANTILKVATDIVAQQNAFFKLGIHHLKPLTLKDVAAATGFHESTVSRVTTGKFIMTPRGLFELKYFFTSGLNHSRGGDDVSSETVRHLIKELIDGEAVNAVLSDDDIAERLKAKNINVARRTVAKYREGMHIPSSTQRRRLKLVAC